MNSSTVVARQRVRDSQILGVFLTVDDTLQGILSLHLYTSAIHDYCLKGAAFPETDTGLTLQITHEWARFYRMGEFLNEMTNSFEFMHCGSSLLSIVAAFEIALQRFKERLWSLGLVGAKGDHYKPSDYKALLRWSYELLKNTSCGSEPLCNNTTSRTGSKGRHRTAEW
jgi:hypothetical protein